MNPLMLINWKAISDGFNLVCWIAAVAAVCLFLANLTATPDVTPRHARPVVLVGH